MLREEGSRETFRENLEGKIICKCIYCQNYSTAWIHIYLHYIGYNFTLCSGSFHIWRIRQFKKIHPVSSGDRTSFKHQISRGTTGTTSTYTLLILILYIPAACDHLFPQMQCYNVTYTDLA